MADYAGDDIGDDMADIDDTGDGDGGGYVDDELDVDDDLDNDGDAMGASAGAGAAAASALRSRVAGAASGAAAVAGMAAVGATTTTATAAAESEKLRRSGGGAPAARFFAPDPRDFALRAVGDAERQIVVARFLTPCPDLAPPTRMRALRDGERSADERREAIKAEKRQQAYENSHIGKTRRQNRNKQGYVDVPERDRKRWTFDIQTPDESGERTNNQGGLGLSGRPPVPPENGRTDDAMTAGTDGSRTGLFDPESTDTRQFLGTFEGKSTSRYAILLVDERSKTADIVPVPPCAWYSMRQKRGRRPLRQYANSDDAERAMKRKAMAGKQKLDKFHEKAEEAQEKSEIGLGSMSAVRAKIEPSSLGVSRKSRPRRSQASEREGGVEGLDFEEEFDNDDVAQVDKEEADRDDDPGEARVDRETNLKKFRKLIKDEASTTPRPGSPASASESDEEDEATSLDALTGMLRKVEAENAEKKAGTSNRTSPFSGSGSRPHSPSQALSPKRSPPPGTAGPGLPPKPPNSRPTSQSGAATQHLTARPSSSRMPTPGTGSPSTSSAPGTPLRQEYAHLLPPPGCLPQARHVVDVLSLMLRNRQNQPVPLKEFTRAFERVTPEQKTNLAGIMKQVAQLTEIQPGSKVYFVSLKASFEPSPSS